MADREIKQRAAAAKPGKAFLYVIESKGTTSKILKAKS
jgi:hypothetical protein